MLLENLWDTSTNFPTETNTVEVYNPYSGYGYIKADLVDEFNTLVYYRICQERILP